MNITRENYEAFFLDYHEGNLTASQKSELMDFLAQNPHLKPELDAFEMISLAEDPPVVFPGKSTLKKTPENKREEDNLEQQMIAHFEGDLSPSESRTLLQYVATNVNARKAFELYSKTHLQADHSIVYPHKSSLKRYKAGIWQQKTWQIAVAAAILGFMVSVYFLMPSMESTPHVSEVIPKEIRPEEPLSTPDPKEPLESTPLLTQEEPIPSPDPIPQEKPRPRQLAALGQPQEMQPLRTALIEPRSKAIQIEKREEFKWFSFAHIPLFEDDDEFWNEDVHTPSRQFSLADIATSGIEKRTGIDVEQMGKDIKDRNFGFWDIAGAGLAGLSQLTGTSLNIDKERDEKGRITLLAIGERFQVQR